MKHTTDALKLARTTAFWCGWVDRLSGSRSRAIGCMPRLRQGSNDRSRTIGWSDSGEEVGGSRNRSHESRFAGSEEDSIDEVSAEESSRPCIHEFWIVGCVGEFGAKLGQLW